MRRLRLHSLALRVAPHLDAPAKFLDTLDRPQLRDILETLDAHEAALFFILGPVQFFKTLVGQLYLLRCHLLRPGKIGWYSPTDDFAKDFADTKLNPLLDAAPDLATLQFDTGTRGAFEKTKLTKLRRSYTGGASHLLLSANIENDRTGKTLEKVLCDEPHLYAPGWLDQIFKRAKDYETTAVKLLMSTGMTRGQDVKGGEAAQLWDQTDQRLWHSRCPHCRKYWEPRYLFREKPDDRESPIIGGLLYERRFNEKGLPDQAAIAATLRYKCPRCGSEKFPDTPATRHALNGDYARPTGLYVCQNPAPTARYFGWNFSALAGRAWLPIVMDWELANLARNRGDLEPLGKVIREHFGGIWNPVEYLKTKSFTLQGGYKMGQFPGDHTPWPEELKDPAGHYYRFCEVDCQQGWFRIVVRGWGPGSLSRLLWADEASSPGKIKEIADALHVIPDRVILDRRYNKTYVRQIAAQFGGWRTLFGEDEKDYKHPDGIHRVISPPMPMDPFNGTIHGGRYRIQEHKFAKWTCLDRLKILRTLQNRQGVKLFTAADDAPEWYFKEMEAYVWIPKLIDGEQTGEWRVSGPDHSPDVECMGIAAASAHNLTGAESIVSAPTSESSPERELRDPAAA
jgi:hypothetical protein